MKVKVLDKRRKILFGVINTSILTFTVLWLLIFINQIFNSEVLGLITGYFIITSFIPLSVGIICSLTLGVLSKQFVEVDEHKELSLTLNLAEDDFKHEYLKRLKYLGNYLIVPDTGVEYEVSSPQVKKLLSVVSASHLNFQKRKTKTIQESPKKLFDSAMMMLWAAS